MFTSYMRIYVIIRIYSADAMELQINRTLIHYLYIIQISNFHLLSEVTRVCYIDKVQLWRNTVFFVAHVITFGEILFHLVPEVCCNF